MRWGEAEEEGRPPGRLGVATPPPAWKALGQPRPLSPRPIWPRSLPVLACDAATASHVTVKPGMAVAQRAERVPSGPQDRLKDGQEVDWKTRKATGWRILVSCQLNQCNSLSDLKKKKIKHISISHNQVTNVG